MDGISRLAIIGGGRMGEAIAAGLVAAGILDPKTIVIAEPDPAKRRHLADTHGIGAVADGAVALSGAEVAILAVKPQVMADVLAELSSAVGGALVVSIAAGITCARLESVLPTGTRVVRVMPNTPALVGAGMSVISGGTEASPGDVELVETLFRAVGDVVVLSEDLQDACTAISGCGPAYMALFVDALAEAGAGEGLDRDLAQRLALQTMQGTVRLIEVTGQSPVGVIQAVSSPGGSTVAALAELEAHEVRGAIRSAVHAAVLRSRELGN
jgi:pyrroline-5-carboxylate reductase